MNTPQPDPTSQKIADRYILKEIIGEGSYSIVFRGYDTENNRRVAIKELKSQGLTKEDADEAQQLFFNEINTLKKLSHPNIPKVYDFFLFEGRHYMVMQWVEGRNLLSLLEEGETLSQGEAIYYMRQITDALIYLQEEERRIVYKDLKPSNIIVNEDGHAWIIDFGTARFYSPEKKKDTHVLGTPGYAPPEAYTGAQTDLSADIYSLGATFYHLVTGQEPFQFKFNFPSPCKFKPELTEKFSALLLSCLKPRDERIPDSVNLKRHIDNLGPEFFFRDGERKNSITFFEYIKAAIFTAFLFYLFFISHIVKDWGISIVIFFGVFMITSPFYYINSRGKSLYSLMLYLAFIFSTGLWLCIQFRTVYLDESLLVKPFLIFSLIIIPIFLVSGIVKNMLETMKIRINTFLLLSFSVSIYYLFLEFLGSVEINLEPENMFSIVLYFILVPMPIYFLFRSSLFLSGFLKTKFSIQTIFLFSLMVYVILFQLVLSLSGMLNSHPH